MHGEVVRVGQVVHGEGGLDGQTLPLEIERMVHGALGELQPEARPGGDLLPSSQACVKYSWPFTPNATTGSEKLASSLATMRSQGQISISPPAITRPCT